MSGVYLVGSGGKTASMSRIRCKNEDIELQQVLEKNHDLLPGDQINPEDPRRWLLIKREMPVPDPGTGGDGRWSIDFLFADQDGIPTFVECKRYGDTRARREVVGQTMEYAANGHYYWDKQSLRDHAEASAKAAGRGIEEALAGLLGTPEPEIDTFFQKMEDNLREGQLRIVFFLEESPPELRSIVDFLNKQMELSEVLLVEARQYEMDGLRVIVPTLFGYTEEARKAKRNIVVTAGSSRRRKWDREAFMADLAGRVPATTVMGIEQFLNQSIAIGFDIRWGTGAGKGSFSLLDPAICPRTLISVFSDGLLQINAGWINGTETAEKARDQILEMALPLGITHPRDGSAYPTLSADEWVPKRDVVSAMMRKLFESH